MYKGRAGGKVFMPNKPIKKSFTCKINLCVACVLHFACFKICI